MEVFLYNWSHKDLIQRTYVNVAQYLHSHELIT